MPMLEEVLAEQELSWDDLDCHWRRDRARAISPASVSPSLPRVVWPWRWGYPAIGVSAFEAHGVKAQTAWYLVCWMRRASSFTVQVFGTRKLPRTND